MRGLTSQLLCQLLLLGVPTTLAQEDIGQIVLEPGLDGTLNHIQYSSAFTDPQTPRHIAAKKRALQQIEQPDEDSEEWTLDHPRWRIMQALHGFVRYKTRYLKQLGKFQKSFTTLPEGMQKVVDERTDYRENFEKTKELWERNGAVAEGIVKHGLEFYNITKEELDEHILLAEKEEKWDNQAAVSDAINHYVRDWAADGQHERSPTFDPITQTIEKHFPDRATRKEGPVTVLTPGQGLGRLPHVIAELGDMEVTSNEYSFYMILAYRYLESIGIPKSVDFHPFIDWWSYQFSPEERMRGIAIPDKTLNASNVALMEGDFMYEFDHQEGHYDVVVTLFFIDTAKNAMEYMDNINKLLKPGGLWINLGPLLYGRNPKMQFSLTEIVQVSEGMGFEFLETDDLDWGSYSVDNKVRQKEINYLINMRGIRRNVYAAQFWAAKKTGRDYPSFGKLKEKSATKEHTFD